MVTVAFSFIQQEVIPRVGAGQLQLRLRLHEGTRLERTGQKTKQLLGIIWRNANLFLYRSTGRGIKKMAITGDDHLISVP
jgi:multidrug efflux pump subunit AcrB